MKIVVRGANWIGDAVMTIPALRLLRTKFPDASISLLTRNWAEGIFRDAEFVDEIIAIGKNSSRITNVLDQARLLRNRNFDLAMIFPNSFETALVAKLSGIPARVGYATEKRSFLLTDAVAVPEWKNERHESHYYLNLVEKLESAATSRTGNELTPFLRVSDERKASARRFLKEQGVDDARPVVAMGAGSTNSLAKRWPAENFANLSDLIHRRLNAEIVLLGSTEESGVAAEVAKTKEAKPVDLTGKTDLASATAILSIVDLFVANDMGLAHIAAAVGTPTIVIFGPTNETTTRPLGHNVEVIREPVECSPCMLRDCPIDHRCMTRILPERVFESAAKMLENQQ